MFTYKDISASIISQKGMRSLQKIYNLHKKKYMISRGIFSFASENDILNQ